MQTVNEKNVTGMTNIFFITQVNNNGHLTFNQSSSEFYVNYFPNGTEDVIAPLWTDVDVKGNVA